MNTAVLVTVRGQVQGVGYRYWAQTVANELGVVGWVRNEPDGEVVAHLEGPIDKVREMARRMWKGPRWSQVADVSLAEADEQGFTRFRLYY